MTVRLADDVDVSRGDLLAAAGDPPHSTREVNAVVAWMDSRAPLSPGNSYLLKHTTRTVRAVVTGIDYRVDIEHLGRRVPAEALAHNEIGQVSLRLTEPVFVDDYRHQRVTGSFVLIDPASNQTAAAGMIRLGVAS